MKEVILHTKKINISIIRLMYLTYRCRKRKNVTGYTRKMTDEEVLETNKQLLDNKINLQL